MDDTHNLAMLTEAGFGPAANTDALSAFDVNEIMQMVSQLYCDYDCGAGIDLYWVNRELKPLPIGPPISYLNGGGRPDAFSYWGEMFYEPIPPDPNFPNNLTGNAQIVEDLLYNNAYPNTGLFKNENDFFREEIANNRDDSLKGFVVLLFKARVARIEAYDGNAHPFRSNLCRAYDDPATTPVIAQQGAIILTTNFSEENPFAYAQPHYDNLQFKSFLAWAVAHEIGHLIIGDDWHFFGTNNLMGGRVPIENTAIASEEIFMINLKNRRGVTQ